LVATVEMLLDLGADVNAVAKGDVMPLHLTYCTGTASDPAAVQSGTETVSRTAEQEQIAAMLIQKYVSI